MTIAPPAPTDDGVLPLSAALRGATAVVHEQAEGTSFVADLLGGRLPLAGYTALVAQNHAVYTALEAVAAGWVGDAVAGPFLFPELTRLPSLEHDLEHLLGPTWRADARALVQPATVAYVDHVQEVAGSWAAGFVAHHYVRYLGDLSGGQVVGRRMGELFGDDGRTATSFYRFDAIGKVKPFRDAYRATLDAVPVEGDERARMLDEAVVAFELNRAVFVDLAASAS